MLRFYIEMARAAFRRQLIYRWANIAGLLTNIFFGSIFSYVIIALYHAPGYHTVGGYDVRDTLRYTWLMQSIIMVVLPFNWTDLMLTIRSGEVVSDLSKPYDFYWYWFSREAGRTVYFLIFRSIPCYIAGALLFNLGLPGDWRSWLAFCLVLTLGAMLGIAYRYLYNVVAFWLLEARSLVSFAVVLAQFFTGSYVPLPLLPTWLSAIFVWLPFNGFMNLPVQVFLGKLTGSTLLLGMAEQVFWLLVLTSFVRGLTTIATRRVIAQGG